MRSRVVPRVCVALASIALLSGCYEGIDADDWYADEGFSGMDTETGDSDPSGQEGNSGGDQEADGEGDTDPDPSTTGDGDGDPDPTTTGDGDGDPDPTTTGDGDGDGDPDPTTTGDGDPDPTTTGDGDPDPTTTGDDDTTGDGDGDPSDVPDNAYCNPVSGWDPAWIDRELEVLALVNQARAQGGNCGSEGNFPPSGPLAIDPALTCAARVHSKDMADNDFFSHTNLEGQGPGWRIDQAGYNGNGWGENIAAGYSTPQQVVDGWLDSDGHCSNMLNPGFSQIGIGYAYGSAAEYGHYWTQAFGG